MANVKQISLSGNENPTVISDSGRIRVGSIAPAFPPVRSRPANTSDIGRVRIGNASPAFPLMPPLERGRPVTISDTGEVRIREFSPTESSARVPGEPNIRIAAISQTFVRSR